MKLFKVVNYLLVLSLFLQMVPASVYASNTKTITVNFSSPPTTAVASKLPLKYGKSFAYSWMFDDGLSDAYRNAFRYLNGGIVDVQSTSLPYPGLYYTDGAGNDVPFRAGYAWYSVNGAFTDLHYDTPGNITYGELRDSYDNGWDVINHGWQSIATPSPANTIINYPAGNGGPRTIDYPYEISQNNNTVKAKLGISKDMSQFALPSGDQLYVDSALADSNIRSVMSQSTTFSVGGSTVTLPHGVNAIDVNPLISSPTGLDDYLMYRKLYSSPTGPDPTADSVYYADADNTYSFSTGGANYWRQAFTHRVYNGVGAMGANFYWTKFKAVVDHIEANYGKSGNDTAWVAGQQEVYEYLLSNQKTDLSQNLSGSTLTITLDTTNVPDSLRRKALSLRVEADTPISSIVYSDGEFTYTSHNTATGLINLDWGEHYSGNLNMHVESALSTAEKSLVLTDKDKAQLWIDLLPSGSEQTVFQNRLDAIPAAERTFQFALTNASTSGGVWNTYSKLLTTDPTLSNVQTIDAVVTSLTLRTVQNFSSKLDGGTLKGSITSNNTGAFPDTYMRQGFVSASGVTSTLRLSNLNTSKLYAFKLLGSTIGRTAGYNAASTSNYQIAGSNTASGSLNAFQNFQNTFTAKGIAPTVGGTIDITISPADGAGAAYLNAFTLTEVTPPPVSSLSASPATINQGDSTTLTWSSTNSTSCSASWTNSTATSGTQVVSPVANTDYT
ncbi:MAG: hypothetical protein NTY12_05015, partial [Candidatus Falkowbacteria bacterium]|nr:hypothetical protein [Candidatus Falkowbacteria bacterium]